VSIVDEREIRQPEEARGDGAAPRYAYPGPLSAADVAAMDGVLPDEVTAAHLRWLETGEGDPWGGYSG
jgi:hypothetical protein